MKENFLNDLMLVYRDKRNLKSSHLKEFKVKKKKNLFTLEEYG